MSDDQYDIRLYEPSDEEAFLTLFEEVFGGGSEAWFRWKYPENPYVTHVPMFIAERDDELVGARPYMAFDLQVGDETVLGLQTGDTMVHPDHQRNGLFTRMTARSLAYYGDLEDDVVTFSVPNALSRPGYLKLGCKAVGQLSSAYRIQDPSMLADGIGARLAGITTPAVGMGLSVWDRRTSTPADLTVTSHRSVPAAELAELHRRNVPDGIHAARDRRFYDWRFDRPDWAYETYVARAEGTPVAAVVVGRQGKVAAVTEVLPLEGGKRRERGLDALFDRVTTDHADAAVIRTAADCVPTGVLRSHGFLRDDRFPLSSVTTPTVLISRLFDGTDRPAWTLHGQRLDDLSDWSLTLAEQNTF